MGEKRRKFSREFKIEAVRLVTEGGQTIAETARELGINASLLGRWKQQLTENAEEAFPGKGRMKPLEEEVRRLQREPGSGAASPGSGAASPVPTVSRFANGG